MEVRVQGSNLWTALPAFSKEAVLYWKQSGLEIQSVNANSFLHVDLCTNYFEFFAVSTPTLLRVNLSMFRLMMSDTTWTFEMNQDELALIHDNTQHQITVTFKSQGRPMLFTQPKHKNHTVAKVPSQDLLARIHVDSSLITLAWIDGSLISVTNDLGNEARCVSCCCERRHLVVATPFLEIFRDVCISYSLEQTQMKMSFANEGVRVVLYVKCVH